jgi:hypothetical protein
MKEVEMMQSLSRQKRTSGDAPPAAPRRRPGKAGAQQAGIARFFGGGKGV